MTVLTEREEKIEMNTDNEPPDPGLPQYKTVKSSLAAIVRYPEMVEKISEAAIVVDKIVTRSLMFLKLYLLHTKSDPPCVDENFIDTVFKTVCKETKRGRPKGQSNLALCKVLTAFYEQHFVPLLPAGDKDISYTHLSTVLDYAARQLHTVFETNVKSHYVEYVELYVNAAWQKYDLTQRIRRIKRIKRERDSAIRKLNSVLRDIKTDLLNVADEPYKSHLSYHDWIRANKPFVLPQKARYQKDLLYYDVQYDPQSYYPAMLRMTEYMENAGRRPRSFCPLRTSLVPKHITIDTITLIHILYDERMGMGKKARITEKGGVKRNQQALWKAMFKLNRREFKAKHYTFNFTLDTDGVSACTLLIRKDLVGKRLPKAKKVDKREAYIDDLSDSECESLSSKKVVGIDPNMSDLLFCSNEDGSEQFRYTQNQRRHETNVKRYEQITQKEKKRTHNRVEGRTITEWETDLSVHNHRTVDSNGFKAYIKAKLLVNLKISPFYQRPIWRKLNLNRFWNTRKSEAMMLKGFSHKFGTPEQIVIGIGDWEQKKHRKFKEPVKGKGFRSLLRRGGFKVYLVDEFRTSCKCSHCQHEDGKCETFRVRRDPNRKKKDEDRHLRKVHGILVCRKCRTLWNRDVNSAINTARLTRERLEGRERPAYLSRLTTIGQSP